LQIVFHYFILNTHDDAVVNFGCDGNH